MVGPINDAAGANWIEVAGELFENSLDLQVGTKVYRAWNDGSRNGTSSRGAGRAHRKRTRAMTLGTLTRSRWLVGTLLIAAAALLAIGARVERNSHVGHDKAAVVTTIGGGTAPAEGSEAAEAAETARPGDSHSGEADEKVLGVDLESTPLVALAATLSLALAVATWRSNNKVLLLITAALAAVFTIFDIAEFVHQIDRSNAGLASLAATIAVLHAGAALLAAQRNTDKSITSELGSSNDGAHRMPGRGV